MSPPPNSIPPCHERPKGKLVRWWQGVGEKSWMVWGDAHHPSSLSCLSTPAHLSCFLKWVTSFWGSKPWMTRIARGELWHRVGEKWGSVFGIFIFCFKKKKRKKENKMKYRTASAWPDGKDCGRPHTYTLTHTPVHEPFWSKIV